jgi:hypothetical protein
MPEYLVDFLGPRPESVRGARRWRQLAAGVQDYRQQHGVTDPARALGPEPKTADLAQRQTWRALRRDAERLWEAQQGRARRADPVGRAASGVRKTRGQGVEREIG